ncbi:uncharacterized protein LOC113168506 isoform X2 [Anabas testudineus]|nr:uncharacterized protein LOC113168506 isoform X2 [Anabas testudineus]
MQVTALYITLLTSMLMLASATGLRVNDYTLAFPRVVPNRQQFFQYEPISIDCVDFDELADWRVVRRQKEFNPAKESTWETSLRSRTIKAAYPTDSGEYWCEDKEGKRSKTVSISVTVDDVILDIPALPVTEGDHVSLRCRKAKKSNVISQFNKDGVRIRGGSNGELSIPSVSKSDKGLYKCSIHGAGESAESRLTVKSEVYAHEDKLLSAPLWICISVLCAGQLLLVVGLLYCGTLKHTENTTNGSKTVNRRVVYTVMKNQRREEEPDATRTLLPDESIIFSLVHYR